MGAASLVASAISIVLIVVVAYTIIGGTLVTAEVVATAHKDLIQEQEGRLHTSITLIDHSVDTSASTLYLLVENTGNEPILKFDQMAVFTSTEKTAPIYYPYESAGGSGTWSWISIQPDAIHPHELDPDERINVSVRYEGTQPDWAQVTTPNGVSDSVYLR